MYFFAFRNFKLVLENISWLYAFLLDIISI